jgi:hypothetical protein
MVRIASSAATKRYGDRFQPIARKQVCHERGVNRLSEPNRLLKYTPTEAAFLRLRGSRQFPDSDVRPRRLAGYNLCGFGILPHT